MTKKTKTINEKAIIELSKVDYDNFAKGKKSYKLISWVKDELILNQIDGIRTIVISPKALAKVINLLAFFREDGLTKCDISILDSTEAQINFEFDLTTLPNVERLRLNSTYNVDLELREEPDEDEIYSH